MDYLDLIEQLQVAADTKVVFLVMDGLGGLPLTPDGMTSWQCAPSVD